MDAAITTQNLSRHFGDFKAVDEITFSVKAGDVFGFLGPNGSGKSTTIRMLCGLLQPTAGSGTVAGFDIRGDAEKIKTKIGYMSQRFSLYEDITLGQNFEFWSKMYGLTSQQVKKRQAELFDFLDLGGFENRMTRELPGGIKQRLALGCAVSHDPDIIFLDEPTGGVDPLSRRRFWSLINHLSEQGKTIFVTTHFLDEAEYCNTIAMIHAGRLINYGPPSTLKTGLNSIYIEVVSDHPFESIQTLESLSVVSDVTLFGKSLHIRIDGQPQDLDRIQEEFKSALEKAGWPPRQIGRIQPSLEDVFIHLIEEQQS